MSNTSTITKPLANVAWDDYTFNVMVIDYQPDFYFRNHKVSSHLKANSLNAN